MGAWCITLYVLTSHQTKTTINKERLNAGNALDCSRGYDRGGCQDPGKPGATGNDDPGSECLGKRWEQGGELGVPDKVRVVFWFDD